MWASLAQLARFGMRPQAGKLKMNIYQHDGADAFQFVLNGELSGAAVQELRWRWETASSILNGKELTVDISGITDADDFGRALLSLMRESGARFTASTPPASEDLARCFGLPTAAHRSEPLRTWSLRRLVRLRNV